MRRRIPRRLLTVPAALILTLIVVPLSPLLFVVAWLSDRLASRPRSLARFTVLIAGTLLIETGGLLVALILWVRTGFGLVGDKHGNWQRYRAYFGWYTNTLLGLVSRVLAAPIEWRDEARLDSGPVILAARHTSFYDAVIPGALLAHRNQLLPHHVVMAGLRFAPCIDIVGHRIPTRFIDRRPGIGSSEADAIEAVGECLAERSAAVIFPEGTFRTPTRFDRAVERLRKSAPDHAATAEKWRHMLPPRPTGIWSLLCGAPAADLVLCLNTGLEAYGSLREIVRSSPANHPIVVETWRIPRREIPTDFDSFQSWLINQFQHIEEWVSENRPSVNSPAI